MKDVKDVLKRRFFYFLLLMLTATTSWLTIDLLFGSRILSGLSKQKSVMKPLENGWYSLKANYVGVESFGTTSFTEITDGNGFRIGNESKPPYGAIFLGDSFVHGVGVDYEDSIPGVFEEFTSISTLNGGVSSYSPSAYLNRYKQALERNLLSSQHTVYVGLDISDVQDEAAIWTDGDKHPIKRKNKKSGNEYSLQQIDSRFESTEVSGIKKSLSKKLPVTYHFYVLVRQQTSLQRPKTATHKEVKNNSSVSWNILNLVRSSHTWVDWKYLNAPELNAYTPLGVEGGLSRIEAKIRILNQIVHQNGGKMVVFTYPWPAQIYYESKEKFAFNTWVQSMCNRIGCDSYEPVYESVVEEAKFDANWYSTWYLLGDVHFNAFGNRYIGNELSRKYNIQKN